MEENELLIRKNSFSLTFVCIHTKVEQAASYGTSMERLNTNFHIATNSYADVFIGHIVLQQWNITLLTEI